MQPVAIDEDVTTLLRRWTGGDAAALRALTPLVYDELRRVAAALMAAEPHPHILQPTALVHETFLKLFGQQPVGWRDRSHFLSLAARLMRRILIDHARRAKAAKRGGGQVLVPLTGEASDNAPTVDLLDLDHALTRLAEADVQKAKIVELRFYGGLSIEQTAEVLEISRPTVVRHWRLARGWLLRELSP